MSSTLIKITLSILWHPISLYWGEALSHTDSPSLHRVINISHRTDIGIANVNNDSSASKLWNAKCFYIIVKHGITYNLQGKYVAFTVINNFYTNIGYRKKTRYFTISFNFKNISCYLIDIPFLTAKGTNGRKEGKNSVRHCLFRNKNIIFNVLYFNNLCISKVLIYRLDLICKLGVTVTV